jgi:hypothetical protein
MAQPTMLYAVLIFAATYLVLAIGRLPLTVLGPAVQVYIS